MPGLRPPSKYRCVNRQRKGENSTFTRSMQQRPEKPAVVTRTVLFAQGLPFWGYAYRVLLAKDLAMQPRQANACSLLGFGRRAVTDCEQEFIRRVLTRQESLLWADARQ